jgi:hypothetical protein
VRGRGIITQTIATDLFNRYEAAAVRFPSRLDGMPALSLFEGRGALVAAGEPIELTDPAPTPLIAVCTEWGLTLESLEVRRSRRGDNRGTTPGGRRFESGRPPSRKLRCGGVSAVELDITPLTPERKLRDRSAQLGIPKTITTAIANAMPVKKATHAHLSARQASRPAINACDM